MTARTQRVEEAASDFAADVQVITADTAGVDINAPLAFLLAQVRDALEMDVVFVSRIRAGRRVFGVVSAAGENDGLVQPGSSDPLLDTYCAQVVEGRIPRVITDTRQHPAVHALPVTRKLKISAYLSAVVTLPGGMVFGTVCCISHKSRPDLVESDAAALQAVANAIAAAVDLGKGTVRYASWLPDLD